jgi:hypothetical protein
MTTLPAASASSTRPDLTSTIRARPCVVSVWIPACAPVSETASRPRSKIAMERSAIEICSPAVRSMSSSRACGAGDTSFASSRSSSVVSPIAEATTHTCAPVRVASTARRATRRICADEPRDVPPYFCTRTSWAPVAAVMCPHIVAQPGAEAQCSR